MYYRSIFILVLFALSVSAQRENPKLTEPSADPSEALCEIETGINPSRRATARQPESTEEQLMCFGACVLRKHGTLRENGTLDAQKEIEYLSLTKDNQIQAMTLCANEKGKDDCETVKKLLDCLFDQKLPYEWLRNQQLPFPKYIRQKRKASWTEPTSSMCRKYIYHPKCHNQGDYVEIERAATTDKPKEYFDQP